MVCEEGICAEVKGGSDNIRRETIRDDKWNDMDDEWSDDAIRDDTKI